MQIEIRLSAEYQELFEEIRSHIRRAAENIDRSEQLLAEVVELNLRAKKLLFENAKLLRKAVGGPGALHIADEGDVSGASDEPDGD